MSPCVEASQSWEQYVCWIISALSLATGAIAIGPIVDRSSLFSRKWKSVLVLLTAISAVLIAAEALLLSKDSLVSVGMLLSCATKSSCTVAELCTVD